MTSEAISKTIGKLPDNQLIFSMNELKRAGFSQYKVAKLVENGRLKKLNKSHYENADYMGEESDFYYVEAYAPKGVVCLLSAASHYDLTVARLSSIDVAIPRKGKAILPAWPPISIHYYSDKRYEMGIVTVKEGLNSFKIYDEEKTVADIISFREKIGIEETKDILINYLRRSDRNLNKLIRYANDLGCGDVLSRYLEVLL